MALTRTVLVSTPDTDDAWSVVKDSPFMLQIGAAKYFLDYEELSKIMADADREIRGYTGPSSTATPATPLHNKANEGKKCS